jgi:HK97 family phage major capsid protein
MKLKVPTLTRNVTAAGVKLVGDTQDTRTMEFSFSSEAPVDRWFGREILSHSPESADYSRLNDGAPLLFNHDVDKQIGVVERAWIGNDKRGYAQVRFSKNQLASEKFQDVQDNILRNVSFGYQIDKMEVLKKGSETEEPEYLVTKYMPLEVSFVSVPADAGVGPGRSFEKNDDSLKEMIRSLNEKELETIAPDKIAAAPEGEIVMSEVVDAKSVAQDAVKAERERAASITALGEKYGLGDLARQMIDEGKSIDEARHLVLEQIGTRQKPLTGKEAVIGMTEKEVRQFSFLKALRALANPHDQAMQKEASFEREVSEAAQKAGNKSARGFMVPVDVLQSPLMKRDQVVGTSTAGGNLVSTNLLSQSFIELLRNVSVVQEAGALVLNGLVGNIAIPRQTSSTTAYWIGEGNSPTESQIGFDQVAMSPKTCAGFVDYSRKMMLQSSLSIEALIRADLAKVIALEIDRAALYGSGSSNQPLGLKNVTGINVKTLGAAAPTFAEVVDLETVIASANADVGTMKYLVNAAGRGALKTTPKVTAQPMYLWEPGNSINGYPVLVSNQVASGDYLFGNWANLVLGFWSGLDLTVDPYTQSTSGTVRVVAFQDTDVACRHPGSFSRANQTP